MGWAVDNGVAGTQGRCGGGVTCSTCHCLVEAPWAERLPPQHEDEIELLMYVPEAVAISRLGCQIQLTAELDGLVVTLLDEPD